MRQIPWHIRLVIDLVGLDNRFYSVLVGEAEDEANTLAHQVSNRFSGSR